MVSLIEPGIVGDWLRGAGIGVHGPRHAARGRSPLAVPRLARSIGAVAPSLVHSHMFHANLLARAARVLRPGTRLVNSSHVDERGVRVQHLAYRASRRLCERFHCVSRGALERLARSGAAAAERLVYIPNGVPEPAAAPARERACAPSSSWARASSSCARAACIPTRTPRTCSMRSRASLQRIRARAC